MNYLSWCWSWWHPSFMMDNNFYLKGCSLEHNYGRTYLKSIKPKAWNLCMNSKQKANRNISYCHVPTNTEQECHKSGHYPWVIVPIQTWRTWGSELTQLLGIWSLIWDGAYDEVQHRRSLLSNRNQQPRPLRVSPSQPSRSAWDNQRTASPITEDSLTD